jgi:hypothetical protein
MSFTLDVLAMLAFIIFKLPLYRLECVAQCHVHVLMTVPLAVLFARNDFAARHGQIHAYLIELPLMLMAVRSFDDDVATHDLRTEPVKTLRQFAHARFESGRRFHLAKRDL